MNRKLFALILVAQGLIAWEASAQTQPSRLCQAGVDPAPAFNLKNAFSGPGGKADEPTAKDAARDKLADTYCTGDNDPKCTDPDKECKNPLACKVTTAPRPETAEEKKKVMGRKKPGEFKCKDKGKDGWECKAEPGWYLCLCRCRR